EPKPSAPKESGSRGGHTPASVALPQKGPESLAPEPEPNVSGSSPSPPNSNRTTPDRRFPSAARPRWTDPRESCTTTRSDPPASTPGPSQESIWSRGDLGRRPWGTGVARAPPELPPCPGTS